MFIAKNNVFGIIKIINFGKQGLEHDTKIFIDVKHKLRCEVNVSGEKLMRDGLGLGEEGQAADLADAKYQLDPKQQNYLVN